MNTQRMELEFEELRETQYMMRRIELSDTVCIADFCGISDKFDYRNPFVVGGFLYATDARIAIKVPFDDVDTPPGKLLRPDAVKLFDTYDWDGEGKALPALRRLGVTPGDQGEVWVAEIIDGAAIREKYVRLIEKLKARLLPRSEKGKCTPTRFRFEAVSGGQCFGLVMPLAPETKGISFTLGDLDREPLIKPEARPAQKP